jgi:predicted dehydrogenase
MSRLRVGVVGVGHLGRHHARVLAGIEGVELAGVADARIEQARAVAGPLGVGATADYRELIGRVDAVSIAVPTCLHREVAGAFLERGIPAMVEKPLATGLAEAEALVALAASRGATLQVGHIERFNPALAALEGMRLRPKYIAAERLGTYTFRSTDIGVVLDVMIHDLDLILARVEAPVRSVAAVGLSVFGRHEDVANARIEFEDGCVADVTASRCSERPVRAMRLWGAEGYASLDFMAKRARLVRPSERLRRGEVDTDGLDPTRPEEVRARLFGQILRVDHVQAEGREPLALELEDFVRAVRTGTRPRVDGHDALRAMRLADQVLRGLEAHRWEGTADGPVGPRDLPAPQAEPIAGLPAPKSWRYRGARQGSPSSEP